MEFKNGNFKLSMLIWSLIIIPIFSTAQEICDNGMDDDGDGFIDLLDIDCLCGSVVNHELVADFEDFSCCPSGLGELDCNDDGWVQANAFSPDYFHECGFMGGQGTGVPAVPVPIPSGSGALGVMSCNGCHDNAGLCMPFRLIPGEDYDIDFWVGFNEDNNLLSSLDVEISIFGSYDCFNLPSTSAECLSNVDGWFEIETFQVNGDMLNSWKQYTGSFSPSDAAEAIAIGTSCAFSELAFPGQYHFLDDIHVSGPFLVENPHVEVEFYGDCANGYFLDAQGDVGTDYQWYLDGIAINDGIGNPFQINSDDGLYQVLVLYGDGSCATSEPIEVEIELNDLEANAVIVDLACNAANDGEISLIIESNNDPITYNWSNGASSQNITNLAPGTYYVTVIDANGCYTEEIYEVDTPPILDVGVSVSQPTMEEAGQAEVFPSGGTPGYIYNWSNGHDGPEDDSLAPGIYTVSVTDENGCVEIVEFEIYQPLIVNTIVVDESCYGACDGTITAEIVGGLGPYNFTWYGIGSDLVITDLCPDDYDFILFDAFGTQVEGDTEVIEADEFILEVDYPNVVCSQEETFDIELDIDGGVEPITIDWSNGMSTDELDDVQSGEYSVTIVDAVGCTIIEEMEIGVSPPIEITAITEVLDCDDGAIGYINLEVSGGVEPYDYDWSTGQQNPSLENLLPGFYSVTITDDNGCSAIEEIQVVSNSTLEVNSVVSSVICENDANGSISLEIDGGTGPYDILWSTNDEELELNNLSAGEYSVTVTDAVGCIFTNNYELVPSAQLDLQYELINASCNGEQDGQILLDLEDATGLTFNWSNGLNSQNIDELPAGEYSLEVLDSDGCSFNYEFIIDQPETFTADGILSHINCFGDSTGQIELVLTDTTDFFVNWQDGNSDLIRSNLKAGLYVVDIVDTNLCVQTYEFTIEEQEEMVLNELLNDPDCDDDLSGSISIDPSGGNGPYTILWDSGEEEASITGLSSGFYDVVVLDANGCEVSRSFELKQQTSFDVMIDESNPTCAGVDDGYIELEIDNGTMPYVFNWSNGETSNLNDELAPGIYSVEVVDAANCVFNETFEIIAPQEILANEVLVDSPCFGDLGIITVYPTGGNGVFQYAWSNGDESSSIQVIPGQYNLTLTDENGCEEYFSYELNAPDELEVGVLDQAFPTQGNNNGSISVFGTGGTEPYEYLWSNGSMLSNIADLSFGEYSVTITDANGCKAVRLFDFDPGLLSAEFIITDNLCFGECQGVINVMIQDGVEPYTVLWSDGQVGESIENLCNGAYSATVTDAIDQEVIFSNMVLNSPEPLQLSIQTENESCVMANDGLITYEPSGGEGVLTVMLNDQPVIGDINNLAPGDYQFTVIDENDCVYELETEILSYQVQDIDVSFASSPCVSNEGQLNISSANANSLEFLLNGSLILPDQNGIYVIEELGEYTLSYMDADLCEVELYTFEMVEQFIPESVWLEDQGHYDYGETLELSPDVNGFGAEIISVEWLMQNAFECLHADDLGNCLSILISTTISENISLTLLDENGCEYIFVYSLDVDIPDVVDFPNIFSPNGDGENDLFHIFFSDYISSIKQMRFYDRWGSLVYASVDLKPDDYTPWDGRMNGTAIAEGVYIYFVELEGLDGQVYQFSGDFTLIR